MRKINNDWKFCLIGDEASDAGYDGTKQQQALSNVFTSVNLPHDWSIYNNFKSTSKSTYEGGYLDGGEAWYKKNISIDKDDDARYFLYFEGVYMESDVLLNGFHLNTHKNGYTNFIVELTNSIVDGDNELLVYVKNRQPSSRWYSGSGIYRDVFFIKTGAIGIKQQSVVITTPDLENEIKDNYCTTKVKYTLENTTSETSTVSVESIFKYYGEEIAKKKSNITINANATLTQSYDCIIADPKLWDEHDGQYYTLEMNVYNSNGDLISNSVSYYGYRWFKFDKDTGFWLNGKNIKLRGACMHHDLGCLGAEINQSAIDRQIKSLKEAGFNAIRLTHNPSCAEFTNACMRMGMMCIEEAFDCWTVSKKTHDYARFFMTYAESDLKSMIKRSINNPCVIAWSIGNEIYDTKSNYASRVLQNPVETATQLKTWAYETDPTRPVTMGENGIYDSIAKSVADVMDVVGLNYTAYSQRRSGLPVYGSETTSALSSRCVYEHDATNYQCSSYDDDKVSWGSYAYAQIADMNKYAYCGGMFIWTGWDYIGEPTPFNKYPARSSYFGCVDIAGFPKDSYYLYQSMWTEKPMCHIVPMDWSKWTVGEDVNIMVYSNTHHVRCILTDHWLGHTIIKRWIL